MQLEVHAAGAEHEHRADFRIALDAEDELNSATDLLCHQNFLEPLAGPRFREIVLDPMIRGTQLLFFRDPEHDAADVGLVRHGG